MNIEIFAPFQSLAAQILSHADINTDDGAHDFSHLQRVWKTVVLIATAEGHLNETLVAATLLHDCVPVEKNSPLRTQASRLAAEKASTILAEMGWCASSIDAVTHAIEAHSHSANLQPTTLEAMILQDADRLDSLGMIGVARCFYIAGRMGSSLYDVEDPQARFRSLDDKAFAIDHFQTKLFRLATGFQTRTGARLAAERHARLQQFYKDFLDEI